MAAQSGHRLFPRTRQRGSPVPPQADRHQQAQKAELRNRARPSRRAHPSSDSTRIWIQTFLIAGDPSLEIQAEAINQIAGQTLPADSWANVHQWLKDLLIANAKLDDSMV